MLHRGALVVVASVGLGIAAAVVGAVTRHDGTAAGATSFSAVVDNPWFPLATGTRYVYTGVKDGRRSRDVVTVTRRTKIVDGAPCVVVADRLYLAGRLAERTSDWYSQDAAGNVWYFGEDTAELDRAGHVTSREGTWAAGVQGARAGIYMPAHPHLRQAGLQEVYKGHAEDHFQVIGIFRGRAAPHAPASVLTKEWTPLEPGVIDHKLYVRGVGIVLEQTERGGDERNELVAVSTT
jgi:hypothetical protein